MTGTKRALLVGINEYQRNPLSTRHVKNLKGCVNDVERVRKLLSRKHFGFTKFWQLTNEKATKVAILDALNRAIRLTEPNDVFLFYYSGHGARRFNGAKSNGHNETLVPTDGRSGAVDVDITDDELQEQLLQFRSVNITVILDSCYSGDATRDDDEDKAFNERAIPVPDDEERLITEFNQREAIADRAMPMRSNDDKYVVLSACRHYETARETKFDKWHGVLTYHLCDVLKQLDAAAYAHTAIVHVYDAVMQKFPPRNASGKSLQQPTLEGRQHWQFLGTRLISPDVKIVKVRFDDDGNAVLAAGQIHAISSASVWTLFENDLLSPQCDRSIGTWACDRVFATTAHLKPSNGPTQKFAPSSVYYALCTTGQFTQDAKICVTKISAKTPPTNDDDDSKNRKNLSCEEERAERELRDEIAKSSFMRLQSGGGSHRIVISNGYCTFSKDKATLVSSPANDIKSFVHNLRKLCWFHSLQQSMLDLAIAKPLPKCWCWRLIHWNEHSIATIPHDITNAAKFAMQKDDRFYFEIENLSVETNLYVALLQYTLDYKVEILYPAQGVKAPLAPGCRVKIPSDRVAGTVERFIVTLPDSANADDPLQEMVQLIVTTAPTDFFWLEQRGLAEAERTARGEGKKFEQEVTDPNAKLAEPVTLAELENVRCATKCLPIFIESSADGDRSEASQSVLFMDTEFGVSRDDPSVDSRNDDVSQAETGAENASKDASGTSSGIQQGTVVLKRSDSGVQHIEISAPTSAQYDDVIRCFSGVINLGNRLGHAKLTTAEALALEEEAVVSMVNAIERDWENESALAALTKLVLTYLKRFRKANVVGDRENLRMVAKRRFESPDEVEFQQAVLASALQIMPDDNPQYCEVLKDFGIVFFHLHHYHLAIGCFLSALWVQGKNEPADFWVPGKNKPADVLARFHARSTFSDLAGFIGFCYHAMGKDQNAKDALWQALCIAEKSEEEYPDARCDTLFSIRSAEKFKCYGEIAKTEGAYSKALIRLRTATRMLERCKNIPVMALDIRMQIGSIEAMIGDYDDALKSYDECIRLCEDMDDVRGVANALFGKAHVRQLQGNFDEAKSLVELSQAVHLSDYNAMHAALFSAIALIKRANKALWGSKADEDDPLLKEAELHLTNGLQIAQNLDDKVKMVQFLANMGYLLMMKHADAARTEACFRQAVAIADSNADRLYCRGIAHHGLGTFLWEMCPQRQAEAIAEFLLVESEQNRIWRGLHDDASMISWLDTSSATALSIPLQILYVRQRQFARALEVAERWRARALIESMRASSLPSDKSSYDVPPPATAAEMMQCARRLQTTFVYFSRLPIYDTLLCWVLNASEIFCTAFGYGAQSGKIAEYLPSNSCELASEDAVVARGCFKLEHSNMFGTAITDEQADRLYRALWSRFEQWLPTGENAKIVVIPQDELYSLPFAALRRPDKKRLIECYALGMAPSITWIIRQMERVGITPADAAPDYLIMGNPRMPKQLAQLPFAEDEAREVAKIFAREAIVARDATKNAAIARMPTARVIHLATHNLLDFRETADDTPGALVFAKVEGAEDAASLLTSAEIQQLRLKDTKLVVLSCCNTGHGRLRNEGVVGLTRAFLFAGADAVVMSLWKVPDNAHTQLLMQTFHKEFKASGNVAAALRAAMLLLLAKGRPVNEWASFCAYGNV